MYSSNMRWRQLRWKGWALLLRNDSWLFEPDAEELDPAAVDELRERVDHAVALKLPLVAVAGRKRQQRRAPVPEDRHAHVVAEPRRIPVVMLGAHYFACRLPRAPRPGFAPGVLAVLEHLHAVDEDVVHPHSILVRLLEGRAVGNLRRIEDDDVGEHAFAEEAAVRRAPRFVAGRPDSRCTASSSGMTFSSRT